MDIISKEIVSASGAEKVKIYGLNIGRLAIKKSSLNSKRPGLLSTLMSFTDKEFSDWLPIWTWLIIHPEGTFLIDTGLSSDVNQKGYFKPLDFISKYYFKNQMKFEISRDDEIDCQLKKIGIMPEQISKIILTHLHIDHVGGMKHFPNVPIVLNEKEWKTKDGAFPQLLPPNLNIQTVKLDTSYASFEQCHYLTKSKDLMMIHTPGHTRGHTSVALIADENKMYLFGGDVAYTTKRLVNKTFSSTIKNHKKNIDSCNKIIQLSKKMKIVLLPSHDNDNKKRLANDNELKVDLIV